MNPWLCDTPQCLRDCRLCSRAPLALIHRGRGGRGAELQFPSRRRGGGRAGDALTAEAGAGGGRLTELLAAAAVARRGRRCHGALRRPPQGLHRGLGQLVSAAAPGMAGTSAAAATRLSRRQCPPGPCCWFPPGAAAALLSGGGREATRCHPVSPDRGGLWVALVPCRRARPAVPGAPSERRCCPDVPGGRSGRIEPAVLVLVNTRVSCEEVVLGYF